jgi:hypothetical protein
LCCAEAHSEYHCVFTGGEQVKFSQQDSPIDGVVFVVDERRSVGDAPKP